MYGKITFAINVCLMATGRETAGIPEDAGTAIEPPQYPARDSAPPFQVEPHSRPPLNSFSLLYTHFLVTTQLELPQSLEMHFYFDSGGSQPSQDIKGPGYVRNDAPHSGGLLQRSAYRDG